MGETRERADAPREVREPQDAHETHEAGEANSRRRMPDRLRRFLLRMQGGKAYLPAAYRVVWFRDELGDDWGIRTQLVEGGHGAGFACVRAEIVNPEGRVVSCGHKTEAKTDFPAGWVEKAESGAVARALALLGFGTQFTAELDDGGEERGRLADSPQPARDVRQAHNAAPTAPPAREKGVGAEFATYKGWCAHHGLDGGDAPLRRYLLGWALNRPVASTKDVSAEDWRKANHELSPLQSGTVKQMVADFEAAHPDSLLSVPPDPAPNAVAAGR